MSEREKFYITTPIYYPDNRLHIGHTYTTVAADALARYHRLRGRDTFYLTGTDEHGQKIEQAARTRKVDPQAFVDEMVHWIQDLWSELGISYDGFIRTTDEQHTKVVGRIFTQLYEQGDIYSSTYAGWYCTPCESFFPRSRIEEGVCPDCGRELSWVEEDGYFLALSRYADDLLAHIREDAEFIQPATRRNEMIRFLESGLEDMCVTRRRDAVDWGIPVPFDEDYVIYVWFDAVCNYITAIGYGDDEDSFSHWWPADVHLIGKEILRFHCVIWPIILMALGVELPHKVFGHGWLTLGGEKISKSRGNVVDPFALSEKYGRDAVRYYLLREIPFGADGSYTERALVERTNYDLANDLGNLLSRVTAMLNKYCEGRLVRPGGEPAEEDRHLQEQAHDAVAGATSALEDNMLSDALDSLWNLVSAANKYLDRTAPWDAQAAADRRSAILYNAAESLRILAVALRPFLLDAPAGIWEQLGLTAHRPVDATSWDDTAWGAIPDGTIVRRGDPLFPRMDPDEVVGPAEDPDVEEEQEEGVETLLDYDAFMEMDLRVGRVVDAGDIEGADRLLRVRVDLGETGTIQVVAGIAEHYSPDDLVGRRVVVVANLQPTEIFGIKSEGMVLAAEAGKEMSLVTLDKDMPPGSKVK